ncbi:hypothetical protein BCR33DRAFT_855680 [Rhizoclosmatium globosum]|uniref:Uncharacterized protein n=1 Tax=Rhizoclosmatium globosum TaxID=329046 RepID=A0A1Y2BKQ6_9FUNG|nr:hypothetical protein BCR33DRAFT_855680 [Rhizoclosmatium globosum]|eukprot:ORY35200.1 hypothetical protein BCR33DRAFT_855680 [Rhizoclosmatium globosum]
MDLPLSQPSPPTAESNSSAAPPTLAKRKRKTVSRVGQESIEALVSTSCVSPLLRTLLLCGGAANVLNVFVNRKHVSKRDEMLDRFGRGWKGVLAVKLDSVKDELDQRRLINIMQLYMQRMKKVDRDLLLHFVMVHIHFGMLDEAFAILERFISLPPHSEDSVLVGYAGLLSFVLWRTQTERLRASASLTNNSQAYSYSLTQTTIDESDEENFTSSFYRSAISFFKQSLELPQGYENDMFISCYVKLLLMSEDLVRAEEVLLEFQKRNTLNPNSCRYLLEFYNMNPPPIFPVSLAQDLLHLDPLSEPSLALLPLLSHYQNTLSAPDLHIQVITLIAKRLDYDKTASDFPLWNTLVHHILSLRDVSPTADAPIWQDRRYWWIDLHCPCNNTPLNPSPLKAIALYLICGPHPRLQILYPQTTILSQDSTPFSFLIPPEIVYTAPISGVPTCLLTPPPKKRIRTGDRRVRIEKGFTEQEVRGHLGDLYGFGGTVEAGSSSSDSDDDGDDEAFWEPEGWAFSAEMRLRNGRRGPKARIYRERNVGVVQSRVSREIISEDDEYSEYVDESEEDEDDDDEDGEGGGGESGEGEGDEVEVNRVERVWFENVESSDDSEEESMQDLNGRARLMRHEAGCRAIWDGVEEVARWGAGVVTEGGVTSMSEGESDEEADSSDEEEEFDFNAVLKKVESKSFLDQRRGSW